MPQLARGIASRDLNDSKSCAERVFKIGGTILHGSRLDLIIKSSGAKVTAPCKIAVFEGDSSRPPVIAKMLIIN